MSLEQMHRGQLRGPMVMNISSGPQQFAGKISISSGDTSGVCSITTVKSDSIFLSLVAQVSSANLTDNFVVKSISDSNYFTVGFADGGAIPANVTIHWMIANTVHKG